MPVNVGGAIYGTILVATLLSAESARRETYARTVAAVIVALLAYWLTISYAEYAGDRLERGEPLELSALARTAAHEMSLLYGSVVPLLVLLVCWAAGAALGTAVIAATWSAAAAIVATEVVIGVRADLTGRDLVLQSAVGAVIGVAVITLRVLLH